MDFKKESDLSTIYGKCVSGIQRTCANCNTSKSPAWRGGPAGPKSLCNACGIRYKRRKGILGLRNREEDKKDRRKNKLAISSKKRLLAVERFVLLQRSLLQNHESCSKSVLSKINDECSEPENQLNEVQRRCADCNTTKTPEWRCGPAGPRSLCNACGIRYRKRGRDVLGLNNGELDNKERRKSWGGISYKMRLLALERYALSQRSLVQMHESCSKSDISTADGTCSGLESHFNGIQSCFDCKTTKTPRWRVGPAGPKSLCNACGIKYRRRTRDVVGLNEREGDKKVRRKNKVGVSYKMRSLALERYVLSQRSPLQTHDIFSKSDISTVDGKCSIPENLSTEIKRSCANCNATKTPVWRGGPAGPQSLCNACGIRYRKRRRTILGLNNREEDKKERSKNRLRVPYKINSFLLKRYVSFQRSPQKDESRTKSDISTVDHNCSGPESQSSGNQRSCADCNTTKTPVWRGGPAGPKSLCNACGIRYRKRRGKQTKLKEEEQAAAQLMALSFGSVQA